MSCKGKIYLRSENKLKKISTTHTAYSNRFIVVDFANETITIENKDLLLKDHRKVVKLIAFREIISCEKGELSLHHGDTNAPWHFKLVI
jgi:hypothetical protein